MAPLSAREEQVADLAARSLVDKEIAAALGVCYGTVRKHLTKACGKYGVKDRLALAMARAEERHLRHMGDVAHLPKTRRRRKVPAT